MGKRNDDVAVWVATRALSDNNTWHWREFFGQSLVESVPFDDTWQVFFDFCVRTEFAKIQKQKQNGDFVFVFVVR